MSNTKFDLERFKAGEPAWCSLRKAEFEYVATLPDGDIISRYLRKIGFDYEEWKVDVSSPAILDQYCTMKPKEEWTILNPEYIFKSKQEAEAYIKKYCFTVFEAVKIIRE